MIDAQIKYGVNKSQSIHFHWMNTYKIQNIIVSLHANPDLARKGKTKNIKTIENNTEHSWYSSPIHMSHDLGTVTIFRLLRLRLGFGLGKGLGLSLKYKIIQNCKSLKILYSNSS